VPGKIKVNAFAEEHNSDQVAERLELVNSILCHRCKEEEFREKRSSKELYEPTSLSLCFQGIFSAYRAPLQAPKNQELIIKYFISNQLQ